VQSPHRGAVRSATILLLAITVALLCSSCGSSQKSVVAPVATDSAWIQQFLGGPADFTAMVRPNALRFDTYWGPLVSRLMAHEHGDPYERMSAQQLASARQIDMYVTLRDPLLLYGGGHSKGGVDARAVGWVAIVYGMPPTDPVGLRMHHGEPVFAPPVRLPSGVLMFNGDLNLASESSGLSPTLFFTPDGAWIATDQVSAPHVREFLTRTPNAPPQLSSTSDGLAGVTMSVTSMKFVDSGKSDPGAAMWSGAVAAGLGLRGGANGALEGYADYATSDDADRAYKAFQSQCARKPEDCVIKPGFFKEARAEKDDKRLLVTLAFSDALLRSIRSYDP
jgi:hypothetical protein